MTQDDIIRMAREAGLMDSTGWVNEGHYDQDIDCKERLERFAALVADHEREACAKVCDDMGNTEANMNKTWRNGCSDAAAAIRARGE